MEEPRPAPRTNATTFRVSEIPISVSKRRLLDFVTGILDLSSDSSGNNYNFAILDSSLAPSPADQDRFQVATITFECVPPKLSLCARNGGQVRFEITVDGVSSQVSFDSHFIGMTPLNDGVGDGYAVE